MATSEAGRNPYTASAVLGRRYPTIQMDGHRWILPRRSGEMTPTSSSTPGSSVDRTRFQREVATLRVAPEGATTRRRDEAGPGRRRRAQRHRRVWRTPPGEKARPREVRTGPAGPAHPHARCGQVGGQVRPGERWKCLIFPAFKSRRGHQVPRHRRPGGGVFLWPNTTDRRRFSSSRMARKAWSRSSSVAPAGSGSPQW